MDLNIRDIPEELRQAVRVRAAEQGITLREFVFRVLAQATNGNFTNNLPGTVFTVRKKEKAGK